MPKSTFFNLPDDKRDLILEVAIDEFAGKEYESASISQIVARAGIAKGSFYQYFEDKRDLYFYLVELAAEEKRQFLAAHPPPDPEMNLFDYLRWLLRVGMTFELSRPKLGWVAFRAIYVERPFGDDVLDHIQRGALDYYRSLLEIGVAQGSVDPEIDMDMAVFIVSRLFAEYGRHLIERSQLSLADLDKGSAAYRDLDVTDMEEHLLAFLERGLRPGPRPENGRSGRSDQEPAP
jgi:TetR/AcrR family transcriptional regulator